MINSFCRLLLLFIIFFTSGCIGGGSTSSSSGGAVIITGTASKGLINSGSVSAFELASTASKGRFLAAASTDANGQFTLNIGSHTGGILLEVVGGTYPDEATGKTYPLPGDPQLTFRAAVSSASLNQTISITPFTELACQIAESSNYSIDEANALVKNIFKIDSISVKPVAFPSGLSSATAAQREYTWALATLSQLSKTKNIPISTIISNYKNDLLDGVLSINNAQDFVSALNVIAQGDGTPNNPGYSIVPPASLNEVGYKSYTVKLSVSGTSSLIGGLNLSIILPSSTSIEYFPDYSISSSLAYPSGTAAGTDTFQASYHPNTISIGIVSLSGFYAGEIITFKLKLAPGSPIPVPDTLDSTPYTITDISIYDTNDYDLLLASNSQIKFNLSLAGN